ncbi:hypothetical protein CHUAL_001390 [Chamberlinius hualienensis]
MAVSASGASARNLFADSKLRLADRIQVNVNNIGSLTKHILKGSKSDEILMHTSRNFALQEYAVENSEMNLKRMALLSTHLQMQLDSIRKNVEYVSTVKEQLSVIQQ